MKDKAPVTFILCDLTLSHLEGLCAVTRVASGVRCHFLDTEQGGEVRVAAITWLPADYDAAAAAGNGQMFMVRVMNAAAERLESEYKILADAGAEVVLSKETLYVPNPEWHDLSVPLPPEAAKRMEVDVAAV